MEQCLECMENLWETYPFPTFSHWDKQERTAGKSQRPREQSGRPRTEEVLAGVRPVADRRWSMAGRRGTP